MPKSKAPGDKIQDELDKRDWSQNRLAEEANLQPSTVNHIINGGDPQVSTLKKIAKAFGDPPGEYI